MPQISVDWDTVKTAYPMRPLTGALKTFMDGLGPGNTPCCVQMSHALGVAGCAIPARSNRRPTAAIITPSGRRNYLLAVDEVRWFLTDRYGAAEELSRDDAGGRRSREQMAGLLNGRTGILVFSDFGYGKHTELWDVDHMHQRDMSPALFGAPRVLFWDVMVSVVG